MIIGGPRVRLDWCTGDAHTIGCLAVGDPAIEELFVLASDVGLQRIKVLIAPRDLRQHGGRDASPAPSPWLDELHATLRAEMAALRSR